MLSNITVGAASNHLDRNASNSSNPNRNASVLSTHYGAHSKAESYDNAYFYEPGAYMERLVTLVGDRLQLKHPKQPQEQEHSPKQSRCILDIGGGTGTFAHALMLNDNTDSRVVVVEPFLDQGGSISNPGSAASAASDDADGNFKIETESGILPAVSFVKASAEDFLMPPIEGCWRTQLLDNHHGGYDQVLFKEVVHHFSEQDRVGIFRGVMEGLRKRLENQASNKTNNNKIPSVLIVTRPQTDIDYPLWDAAREVWKENQPSIEALEVDLKQAGYTHLERSVESVACTISLSRWQAMIQSRCWSTFSNFTDDELKAACAVIAEDAARKDDNATYDDANDIENGEETEPILRFEDRLIFLSAS